MISLQNCTNFKLRVKFKLANHSTNSPQKDQRALTQQHASMKSASSTSKPNPQPLKEKRQLIPKKENSRCSNKYMYNAQQWDPYKDLGPIRKCREHCFSHTFTWELGNYVDVDHYLSCMSAQGVIYSTIFSPWSAVGSRVQTSFV